MRHVVLREDFEGHFQELCSRAGRCGVIGYSQVELSRLLPEQKRYLEHKLAGLNGVGGVTAISLGLLFREAEMLAVPSSWRGRAEQKDGWNEYARAYGTLNRLLNEFTAALAERFGGVAEQATMEGCVGGVQHVTDYFPHCVSHRTFAEAAGLGWRGRHGLIVTPQAGPALRFATVFVPGVIPSEGQELAGCGDCTACLDVCPVLRAGGDYREACRRRIDSLGLEDEVCGICVRACWEQVMARGH